MLCLRQKGSNQISLVDLMLPPEATELPKDLAKIDAWLDDERFFIPFRDKTGAVFRAKDSEKPKQLIGRLEEAITRGRRVIAQTRQVNALLTMPCSLRE